MEPNELNPQERQFADRLARLSLEFRLSPIEVLRLFGRMTQPMALMHALKNDISVEESIDVFRAVFNEGVALGMAIKQPMLDIILKKTSGAKQ